MLPQVTEWFFSLAQIAQRAADRRLALVSRVQPSFSSSQGRTSHLRLAEGHKTWPGYTSPPTKYFATISKQIIYIMYIYISNNSTIYQHWMHVVMLPKNLRHSDIPVSVHAHLTSNNLKFEHLIPCPEETAAATCLFASCPSPSHQRIF